jgi:hypothetical protein
MKVIGVILFFLVGEISVGPKANAEILGSAVRSINLSSLGLCVSGFLLDEVVKVNFSCFGRLCVLRLGSRLCPMRDGGPDSGILAESAIGRSRYS